MHMSKFADPLVLPMLGIHDGKGLPCGRDSRDSLRPNAHVCRQRYALLLGKVAPIDREADDESAGIL
jgi:hypothetical protein